MNTFKINPIGSVIENKGELFIQLEPGFEPGLKELEGFSHLNVFWWFTDCDFKEARKMLEFSAPYKNAPPVVGVFATRGPARPNPIGLTTVQILKIDYEKGIIKIPYIDAYPDTPIIDLKPYTPSADRVAAPSVPTWCRHWPKSLEEGCNFNWDKEYNFK